MKALMKPIFVTTAVLITAAQSWMAFAGGISSGGGFAVKFQGKTVLYDFLEDGIETSAKVSVGNSDEMGCRADVDAALVEFPANIRDLVTSQLNGVYKKVPQFASMILERIKAFEWRVVSPEVYNFGDIGRTMIRNQYLFIYPVAARDANVMKIYIQSKLLKEMSTVNQVGLIFHEAIYSLISRDKYDYYASNQARTLNASIFNSYFAQTTGAALIQKLNLAKIPAPAAGWISYENLTLSKTWEFQGRCSDFTRYSSAAIHDAFQTFTAFVDDINAKLDKVQRNTGSNPSVYFYPSSGGTENLGFANAANGIKMDQVTIDGRTYHVPTIPRRVVSVTYSTEVKKTYEYYPIRMPFAYTIYYSTNGIFGRDNEKDKYEVSEKTLSAFRKHQQALRSIYSSNESSFFGLCIPSEITTAIRRYLEMDLNPRKLNTVE